MRKAAVLRALTGLVLASAIAVACGDGAAPAGTPTDLPASTPYPETTPTAYVPRDLRVTQEVIQRLLPSPDATSAMLGISPPGEWLLEPGIGLISDESEALRLARSGITAGWVAEFRPGHIIGVSLFFHATPEDAERTYQHQRRLFNLPDERDTIADAVSMMTWGPALSPDIPTTTTFMIMRQQTVTAFVSMTHDEDRGVSAGLREFARMLALGIDEFAGTQSP